jgi:hypothetical protein
VVSRLEIKAVVERVSVYGWHQGDATIAHDQGKVPPFVQGGDALKRLIEREAVGRGQICGQVASEAIDNAAHVIGKFVVRRGRLAPLALTGVAQLWISSRWHGCPPCGNAALWATQPAVSPEMIGLIAFKKHSAPPGAPERCVVVWDVGFEWTVVTTAEHFLRPLQWGHECCKVVAFCRTRTLQGAAFVLGGGALAL